MGYGKYIARLLLLDFRSTKATVKRVSIQEQKRTQIFTDGSDERKQRALNRTCSGAGFAESSRVLQTASFTMLFDVPSVAVHGDGIRCD